MPENDLEWRVPAVQGIPTMDEYHEIRDRRVEQFARYLQLMRKRQRGIASAPWASSLVGVLLPDSRAIHALVFGRYWAV